MGFLTSIFQMKLPMAFDLQDLDMDVVAENKKVADMAQSDKKDMIVVNDLKKQYGWGWTGAGSTKVAVRGVSFTVEAGQCFVSV